MRLQEVLGKKGGWRMALDVSTQPEGLTNKVTSQMWGNSGSKLGVPTINQMRVYMYISERNDQCPFGLFCSIRAPTWMAYG